MVGPNVHMLDLSISFLRFIGSVNELRKKDQTRAYYQNHYTPKSHIYQHISVIDQSVRGSVLCGVPNVNDNTDSIMSIYESHKHVTFLMPF